MSLAAECKAFLSANKFEYKHGQWRAYIDGSLGLTKEERDANNLGGRPFGRNAVEAVANLALSRLYDQSLIAKTLFNKHKVIPVSCNDNSVTLYGREMLNSAISNPYDVNRDFYKAIITKWDH